MTYFRFILPIIFLLFTAITASAGAPPSTLNLGITATAADLAALSPDPATVFDDRLNLQVTARGETGTSLK